MRKVMPPPLLLIRSWRRRYVRGRGPRITSVDSLGLTASRDLVADRASGSAPTRRRPSGRAGPLGRRSRYVRGSGRWSRGRRGGPPRVGRGARRRAVPFWRGPGLVDLVGEPLD